MKAKVQNEVKKIRNKEEQVSKKIKKDKQQLDDDGSMEKNKEKLYEKQSTKSNKLIVWQKVMLCKERKQSR